MPGVHSPAQSIKQTLPQKKSLALGDLSSTLGGDGETKQPPQPFLLPSFPLCKILPGPTQKAGFVQESKPNVLPSKNVITMRKPSFPGNRKPFNFRARLASVSKIKKEGGLWESSVCCNLLPGIWGLLFHLGDTWST